MAHVRTARVDRGSGDDPADAARAAFDALFRQHYVRVAAIARRVLGEAAWADDVAQDVFLEALSRDVAERERPEAWLNAAAVHTALNRLRSDRRRAGREQAARDDRLQTTAPEEPEGALQRAHARRAVRAALSHLPERQAAILVLRHSGLRYAEVAMALGIPAGSVGTLLRRAEQAMRRELERDASI